MRKYLKAVMPLLRTAQLFRSTQYIHHEALQESRFGVRRSIMHVFSACYACTTASGHLYAFSSLLEFERF